MPLSSRINPLWEGVVSAKRPVNEVALLLSMFRSYEVPDIKREANQP
jgi:hypothetical protein